MSTLEETLNSSVSITIIPKETAAVRLVRRLIYFSLLAFCIYLSQGNTWWTFVTGLMFITVLGSILMGLVKESTTCFTDKASAIEYLEKLKN